MAERTKAYNDMTTGPEWKRLLGFALPIMLGQLLQQLYSTVDGIVVGNYVSSGALAAVGSCTTMAMIFIAFSLGMGNGSGVVVAQFFGAGRHKDMRETAANILLLLGVMGLATSLLAVCSAGFCTRVILGIDDPAIQAEAEVYLRIYGVGLLFGFLYNAIASILRAVGDSKAVLYFLLVSTLANIVLDLFFVRVLYWGVAGAAWATVFSQVACTVVSFWYLFRHYPVFRFTSAKELRFDRTKMQLCLRMGVPSTLQMLTISCGHVLLQRLINSFGEVTMAAVTVGSRFDHYCSVPIMAVAQSISSFAGQNTGAGRYDRVKRGLIAAVAINLCMLVVIGILLYLFAEPLAKLFGVEGETLRQAVEYLRYLCLVYPVFGTYNPFNGLFQGCGEPLWAALVSLVALSGRVGLAYLLILGFQYDYHAIWTPYLWGWTAALVLALVHFASGKWKTRSLVKTPEVTP